MSVPVCAPRGRLGGLARRRRASWRTAVAVLLATVLTGGCAQSPEVSGGESPTAAQGSTGARSTHIVRVGLTEWEILTSVATVPPGNVSFRVTNAGATEHDLVVQGRGGTWRTADLDPGAAQRLTVEARPGESLKLWCSEPGHEIQGMHTTLRVSA